MDTYSIRAVTYCFHIFDASSSVTRLGNFWKVLATKFIAKEAQMIYNFLGYFEKPHYYEKTVLATFGATFGKNWATFYSICSHWLQVK